MQLNGHLRDIAEAQQREEALLLAEQLQPARPTTAGAIGRNPSWSGQPQQRPRSGHTWRDHEAAFEAQARGLQKAASAAEVAYGHSGDAVGSRRRQQRPGSAPARPRMAPKRKEPPPGSI